MATILFPVRNGPDSEQKPADADLDSLCYHVAPVPRSMQGPTRASNCA